MKRIALFTVAIFGLCTMGAAQDFSFDDLVKLRSQTYPDFETAAHNKGYEMDHLEYNDRCGVFRKHRSVISYCHSYDNGYSYHNHVVIKFETDKKEDYEKIKQSVVSSMQYYKTKLRRLNNEHYMEHIYVNDKISVHLYDISFRDDDRPYYQVEISSINAN